VPKHAVEHCQPLLVSAVVGHVVEREHVAERLLVAVGERRDAQVVRPSRGRRAHREDVSAAIREESVVDRKHRGRVGTERLFDRHVQNVGTGPVYVHDRIVAVDDDRTLVDVVEQVLLRAPRRCRVGVEQVELVYRTEVGDARDGERDRGGVGPGDRDRIEVVEHVRRPRRQDPDEERGALSAKDGRTAREQAHDRNDAEHTERVGVSGGDRVPESALFDGHGTVGSHTGLLDPQEVVCRFGQRERDRHRGNDREECDVSAGDTVVATGVLEREQHPRDGDKHDPTPRHPRPPQRLRRGRRREAKHDTRRPPRLTHEEPDERNRTRLWAGAPG